MTLLGPNAEPFDLESVLVELNNLYLISVFNADCFYICVTSVLRVLPWL